jgi:hypothetical protein
LGGAEVDDLDLAIWAEEDVLELRVAMRHAFAVDIRDRREDLLNDASNEVFAVASRRTEVRKRCVARAVPHYEIAIQVRNGWTLVIPGWRSLMMTCTSGLKRASTCSFSMELFGMILLHNVNSSLLKTDDRFLRYGCYQGIFVAGSTYRLKMKAEGMTALNP